MDVKGAYLALALLAGPAQADSVYYFNENFDVSAMVPADYEAQPPSHIGDGQDFVSPDGTVHIRVWGRNDLVSDIGFEFQQARRVLAGLHGRVAFEWQDADGFVLSGMRRDGTVFFRRSLSGETCEGEPVIGSVQVDYPAADKIMLQPLVAELADSLHIGACG